MGSAKYRPSSEAQSVRPHNADGAAHPDIRAKIEQITTSEGLVTRDQMVEYVRVQQASAVVVGDGVVEETTFGLIKSEGLSATAARVDHSHGSPIDPVPAHSAQISGVHGLGTASQVDVPLTGDASADQAVLGSDTRLEDPRDPNAHAASHKSAGSDSIKLDELAAPTDVTTLNTSTSAHGLCPKLSNVATEFLNGIGAFATPAGGAGGQVILKQTLGAATTAWTVTLPVACKVIRMRLSLINPSAGTNSVTLGINSASTGHRQYTYSTNGTTVGAGESATTEITAIPSGKVGNQEGTIYIVNGETRVNLLAGTDITNDSLIQASLYMRIAQSADISTITITGDQTNGIGSGSYIIVERVDADVAPVFGVVFAGTADKTVSNTASETSLIPTGVGSVTLPANSPSIGKMLKIRLAGKYSSKTAPAGNITLQVKLGTTVVNTTGAHAIDAGETDQLWIIDLVLCFRTIGASGTVIGQTGWQHTVQGAVSTAMQVAPMVATAPVTINTTIAQAVDVTEQFSTANASNTITTTCCQIEWLN
jgi:hypothetical protein